MDYFSTLKARKGGLNKRGVELIPGKNKHGVKVNKGSN